MKKFVQKLAVGATSLMMLSSVVAVSPALAQLSDSDAALFGLDESPVEGLGSRNIREVITNVITTLMGFLGTVAVCIILFGGFKWMTAAGDETKVKKARDLIIAGCIGLIIILSAYAIVVFVVKEIMKGTA